jgi:hypothetical protein
MLAHFARVMSKQPFLQSYDGQTTQHLIALRGSYRIDSLVLAFEQALGRKPDDRLTEPERVVLAVEAMEREVNNGGYEQFFGNLSREFTGFIVRALELIGCPKCAAITGDAIAVLELPAGYDHRTVEQTIVDLPDDRRAKLGECDSRYYDNDEPIADALFTYIEQHQHEIQIPCVG